MGIVIITFFLRTVYAVWLQGKYQTVSRLSFYSASRIEGVYLIPWNSQMLFCRGYAAKKV